MKTIPADPDGRFWLTLGVARAAGVDLVGALQTGRLTQDRLSSMVACCAACDRTAPCIRRLADPRTGGEGVPPWCRNAEAIKAASSA